MYSPSAIFQRTSAGRDEIYKKSHGLTQSERLVLIMTDGATPYTGVRRKLSSLNDERFHRALGSLLKKDLVFEVLLPEEGQAPEEVEAEVIDRFLQQDPLDPLTIIALDEDEMESRVGASSGVEGANALGRESMNPPEEKTPQKSAQEEAAALAADFAEIDAFVEAQRFASASPKAESVPDIPTMSQILEKQDAHPLPLQKSSYREKVDGFHLHWGYLLIGIGLAFIIGFVLGRSGA